jgi:A/G-specific adenine glycosylase
MVDVKALNYFISAVRNYYITSGRNTLPWRGDKHSPYEIWVSEIMLQQTQVKRTVLFYERFLKRFPNIFVLSKASWNEFLPYFQGIGYYARGKNMLKTAKIVCEKFNGLFPDGEKILCTLPGIGPYTARAILCFAYGQNTLTLETNEQKILGRYFEGSKTATLKKDLLVLLQRFSGKELNLGMMDLSAKICQKNPLCGLCPLKSRCKYAISQGKNENRSLNQRKHGMHPKRLSVPIAGIYLWLHENHKKYFSPSKDGFQAFYLNSAYLTREKIKRHFREKYHLEVSVRPPHRKVVTAQSAYLCIRAQILSGKHQFFEYSPREVEEYNWSFCTIRLS